MESIVCSRQTAVEQGKGRGGGGMEEGIRARERDALSPAAFTLCFGGA